MSECRKDVWMTASFQAFQALKVISASYFEEKLFFFNPCPPTFLDSVVHNFNKCLANFNKHISTATHFFCSFAFLSHLCGKISIPKEPKHLLFHYLQPGGLALVTKNDFPTSSRQPQWPAGKMAQSGTCLPWKPPQNSCINAGMVVPV